MDITQIEPFIQSVKKKTSMSMYVLNGISTPYAKPHKIDLKPVAIKRKSHLRYLIITMEILLC